MITSFPLLVSMLLIFSHREAGAAGVVAVCRGVIVGLPSSTCFAVALSVLLVRLPPALALAVAALAAVCGLAPGMRSSVAQAPQPGASRASVSRASK